MDLFDVYTLENTPPSQSSTDPHVATTQPPLAQLPPLDNVAARLNTCVSLVFGDIRHSNGSYTPKQYFSATALDQS